LLTNSKIKNSKPSLKRITLSDSHGLVLFIEPSGSKLWRYRYRWQRKATMMSLGKYPEVTIIEARSKRDEIRNLINSGINPQTFKKNSSDSGITFNEVFNQWHQNQLDNWTASYAHDIRQRAETYLIKYLGKKPITEISSKDIKMILLDLNNRDLLDTLEKIRGIAKRVFAYAVGMDWVENNPARDIPLDIFKKKQKRHYATITNPNEISRLLKALEMHKGSYEVRMALKIAPHLFLRPGELVGLRWSEVDLDENIIRINASRMKMKLDHIVPISSQVKKMLIGLKRLTAGDLVFPGRNRTRNITTNSLLVAIRSLGFGTSEFTTHGFRHMASTRLNEMGFKGELIEKQLAHREKNNVRAVYNHADYLEERKEMMQTWSNYLNNLKS
jgi:integrase